MLGQAFAIYRRHFGALVLTCALALVPANLVMSGAVVFGLASMGATGVGEARTHTEQIQQKQQDLTEKPPAPEDRPARVQQLGREALEGGSAFNAGALETALHDAVPVVWAVLAAVGLLLAGVSLAHAALVPLVLEERPPRPARAWAAVAARLGALFWTALAGVPLVALGTLFFVVPGIVLALGLAFAIPVTMQEGLSGRAALHRSWALTRGYRWPLFGMFLLLAFFTALASGVSTLAAPGPWRAVVSGAVRLFTYPLPLVGLVLLYAQARRLEPASDQYMRRSSAPG